MKPRSRLAADVAAAWHGDGSPLTRAGLAGLAPFSWAFRGAVAARNRWYDVVGGREPPIPTVSVGNLTVGGAGKTPVLRGLHEGFEARGVPAALVTRGYGGDEVALYREWFGEERLFVSPARLAGVGVAARTGYRVALIDDGFQHRHMARTVDVLLVASNSPFPVRLLPRGPYREPLTSARRASVIVVVARSPGSDPGPWLGRMSEVAPDVPLGVLTLGPLGWATLDGSPADAPTGPLAAVASTANPAGFARLLEEVHPGEPIDLHSYPDHHRYGERDAEELAARAGQRTLVTTEKDAVKLRRFAGRFDGARVLRFGILGELPPALSEALNGLVPEAAPW